MSGVTLRADGERFAAHVEVDARAHNQDARRDRRIRMRATGIELLYFTWDDVVLDAGTVEREIRDAIGRRLGQLSAASSG